MADGSFVWQTGSDYFKDYVEAQIYKSPRKFLIREIFTLPNIPVTVVSNCLTIERMISLWNITEGSEQIQIYIGVICI